MDNDDVISSVTLPNVGDIWFDTSSNSILTYDSSQWITISNIENTIDISSIVLKSIDFEDCMPEVAKVEDMCNEYPALAKAYENFKTIYKMVEQDWIGNQKIKQ
jgi:hypothetical protein